MSKLDQREFVKALFQTSEKWVYELNDFGKRIKTPEKSGSNKVCLNNEKDEIQKKNERKTSTMKVSTYNSPSATCIIDIAVPVKQAKEYTHLVTLDG